MCSPATRQRRHWPLAGARPRAAISRQVGLDGAKKALWTTSSAHRSPLVRPGAPQNAVRGGRGLCASSGRASTKATAPTAVAISTMPALACLRGERDDQEVQPSVDRAPHSGCCWELFVCQGLGSRRGGLLDGCAERMSLLGNDAYRFLCAACPVMTCGLRSPRRGWPKRAVFALCGGRP